MDDLILGGIMLYFFSQARNSNKNTTTTTSEKNTPNPDKEIPTTSLCKLNDVDFSLFTNSPAKGRNSSNQIFRLFIELLVNKSYDIESMNAKIYFDDTEVNHIKSKMQLHLDAGQTTKIIIRSKKDLMGIVPVEAIGDGMAFNIKIKGSFKTSSSNILFELNKKIEEITLYMHTELFDENKTASKRYIDTPLIFSDPNRNGYFYYEYGTIKYTNTLFTDPQDQDNDRIENKDGHYTGTDHFGNRPDEDNNDDENDDDNNNDNSNSDHYTGTDNFGNRTDNKLIDPKTGRGLDILEDVIFSEGGRGYER